MYFNGFDNWFTPTQNKFHPTHVSNLLKHIAGMLNKLCSIIISAFYSFLWATPMLIICVIDYFSITGKKLGFYQMPNNFLIVHIYQVITYDISGDILIWYAYGMKYSWTKVSKMNTFKLVIILTSMIFLHAWILTIHGTTLNLPEALLQLTKSACKLRL